MLFPVLCLPWLSALVAAAYNPPSDPAVALVSRSSRTLYLVYPAGDSSRQPRFFSLPLDKPFTTKNATDRRTELPPIPVSKDVSVTPLLLPAESQGDELKPEYTTDELYVFTSDDSTARGSISLLKYDASAATDWIPVDLKPSRSENADVSETTPLPAGRSWGAAFAYTTASTTSSLAPKHTDTNTGESGDEELDAYERGDVVSAETSTELFYFGGMFNDTSQLVKASNYSSSLITVQLPVDREVGYVPGEANKTARSAGSAGSVTAMVSEDTGESKANWPIPESEFAMTWVPTSSGEGAMVMIGGIAEGWRWIGMRQVALFHLPDQKWEILNVTYPDVDYAEQSKPTAVLVEEGSEPEFELIGSRSGHTAVTSPDGTQVIVYGGYVGNINTTAMPQLIVLDLSTNEPEWIIPNPDNQQNGPPVNESLWGHAAAMLGDVMIITSGNSISATPEFGIKPNTNTYLYNVTSKAWVTDYDPTLAGLAVPVQHSDAQPAKEKKKVAIAVGVTIAAVVSLLLVGVGIWYKKRRDKRRKEESGEMAEDKSDSNGSRKSATCDSGVGDGSRGSDDTRSASGSPEAAAHENLTRTPSTPPRLRPLNLNTASFAPIFEHEEFEQDGHSSGTSETSPALSDPVDMLRRSYDLARSMTSMTDAVEHGYNQARRDRYELHMPAICEGALPPAGQVVPSSRPASRNKHVPSSIRSLPASLRIVPPETSPVSSANSSPLPSTTVKQKERCHSLVASLRGAISSASSRSLNTPSPISPLSNGIQDVASSDSSQHYRGSGNINWETGVSNSSPDENWDPESTVEQKVAQVMSTAPRGALKVVNVGEDGQAGDAKDINDQSGQHESGDVKGGEKAEDGEKAAESGEAGDGEKYRNDSDSIKAVKDEVRARNADDENNDGGNQKEGANVEDEQAQTKEKDSKGEKDDKKDDERKETLSVRDIITNWKGKGRQKAEEDDDDDDFEYDTAEEDNETKKPVENSNVFVL